jgi:hypothetical protein|tara:strand:+ start:555 stop:731 length:177 start_codon:yes stop_codon:yes gene_type:complete
MAFGRARPDATKENSNGAKENGKLTPHEKMERSILAAMTDSDSEDETVRGAVIHSVHK